MRGLACYSPTMGTGGQQLIPRTWIEAATRVHPEQAHLQPGTAKPFFGYGGFAPKVVPL